MKVIKKSAESVQLEPAHDGAGSRKVLIANDEVRNVQGLTHSWLPIGKAFAWHKHDDCNECMYVLKGHGVVRDEDGEYEFHAGDCFIFPQGTSHELINTGRETVEAIFIRVK